MEKTPEQIKEFITAGMECTHIEVNGDGRHFTPPLFRRALPVNAPSRANVRYTPLWESEFWAATRRFTLSMKTHA